jgi:hypothetical protein
VKEGCLSKATLRCSFNSISIRRAYDRSRGTKAEERSLTKDFHDKCDNHMSLTEICGSRYFRMQNNALPNQQQLAQAVRCRSGIDCAVPAERDLSPADQSDQD